MSFGRRGVRLSHKAVPAKSKRRADIPDIKKGHPGGLFVRSTMEANFIRIVMFLKSRAVIFDWQYEPKTFLFAPFGYKRGPWAYTPDVLIKWYAEALRDERRKGWAQMFPGTRPPVSDGQLSAVPEWFEVKGREVSSDRSKAKRMAKHFPEVQVSQLDSKSYRELTKIFKPLLIEVWE